MLKKSHARHPPVIPLFSPKRKQLNYLILDELLHWQCMYLYVCVCVHLKDIIGLSGLPMLLKVVSIECRITLLLQKGVPHTGVGLSKGLACLCTADRNVTAFDLSSFVQAGGHKELGSATPSQTSAAVAQAHAAGILACKYVCMYVCMYVCTCVRTYLRTCAHM